MLVSTTTNITATTAKKNIRENRRHGNTYNIEELKKIDKEFVDWILQCFDFNLQDLGNELDIDNKEINTYEIRDILKGIESSCNDIDDLAEENKIKK